MKPLPATRARVFVGLVAVVALPLFAAALRDVLNDHSASLEWMILTGLTVLTTPLFVLLPSVTSLVTIGDAFVISIVMIAGPSPAVLAHTLNIGVLTLLLRSKLKTPLHKVVFNIALAVINATLFGAVFESLGGSNGGPDHGASIQTLIVPTFAVAVSFFLSNSILVATAIALTFNKSVWIIWKDNYPPLFLDYLVSAAAAAFIMLTRLWHPLAPLLAAPFVAAVWGINKINRAKAVEAERHLSEQEQLYKRTVESLALAVDAKDQTTYGHIRRVRAYAMGLAHKAGLTDPDELKAIETGSLLHDIGKLAIDDFILNKPGKLSRHEFEKMKLHSTAGHEILEQIQFPFPVARYVRSHHEKWDGNGYPDGLKGTEIPIGARILAIADAFDTIRSSRPYKRPCTTEEAVALLKAKAGSFFDPALLKTFTDNIPELEAAAAAATQEIQELSFRKVLETANTTMRDAESPPAVRFRLGEDTAAELLRLAEFVVNVGRSLPQRESFHVVSQRVARLVPYTTMAVYVDQRDGCVRAVHVAGKLAEQLANSRVEIGKGISGWVTGYKRPVLNTDPALEFAGRGSELASFTDAIAVPVHVGDDCRGALALFAEPPILYSESDLRLLESAARIVAPLFEDTNTAAGTPLRDPVTGAFEVAYLAVAGAQLVSGAQRGRVPFSLACFDLRNLAQIKHAVGAGGVDSILRQVAQTLRTELRDTDVLVRYGNQVLVALLPGVRADLAARQAHSLRRKILGLHHRDLAGHSLAVQCETGVATYPEDGTGILELLEAAARSLAAESKSAHRAIAENERHILEFPPRA